MPREREANKGDRQQAPSVCEARQAGEVDCDLSSNNDGLLSSTRPRLARLINVIQAKDVFWCKLVVVYCVV